MAQDSLRHVETELDELVAGGVLKTSGRNLHCEECGKPLYQGERKVHRVACAHQRALKLQRMRRRLKRS